MAIVCAVAFAVGSAIRFNITQAEPVLAQETDRVALSLERCSDFALIVAYIISVGLYLHILPPFVLGGLGAATDLGLDVMTTAMILAIALIGLIKGLGALDILETIGLLVTLVIIACLIVAFVNYDLEIVDSSSGIQWPPTNENSFWSIITIVSGTLIVVQGFETPRYLGALFDAETRVRASRLSQIIATTVYLVFVASPCP